MLRRIVRGLHELAEPLYGLRKYRTVDPDTKTSQGDVLNEFIFTPGQVQTSTINVASELVKSVDLTVYNLGPNDQHQPEQGRQPADLRRQQQRRHHLRRLGRRLDPRRRRR